jgi:hypothetical protein
LIAALRATINGCSASVTESGGWCVAAPVECEQTSAARNDRQRAKSRKMNLNKRVERTRPEAIEHL